MKKTVLSIVCSIILSVFFYAQEQKYQLSTHILDISTGLPASNVEVQLEKKTLKNTWEIIDHLKTDTNGRISSFLKTTDYLGNEGIYKLTFFTEPYFKSKNTETFYPYIQVVFEIKAPQHYHVPITLSPFGYSTYRGS